MISVRESRIVVLILIISWILYLVPLFYHVSEQEVNQKAQIPSACNGYSDPKSYQIHIFIIAAILYRVDFL